MFHDMTKVIIYSTNYCPYCRAAKNLLNAKGVAFTEFNVENDPEKRKWLVETTGQATVPQIFIDDKPYGGFSDIQALDSKGELNKILGI